MGRELSNFEIESITRVAYEANRAFCEAQGDFSHGPWDAVPNDLKIVARNATIGIATLDLSAKQSHEMWVSAKRAQGWSHGEKKDSAHKLHPCLVEWDELSFEQQAKDKLWIQVVKSMLAAYFTIPRQ